MNRPAGSVKRYLHVEDTLTISDLDGKRILDLNGRIRDSARFINALLRTVIFGKKVHVIYVRVKTNFM